ncbi:MAG: cysteinyl-tRNA synthetase, partial [Thermoleophilaceae bacterium]|nr:cysteinyl-tRNA synthetase [Thermoleophilaceae bacterium]
MKIYDTLSQREKEVEPVGGKVRIYACGPTVYAPIHVGNARPFVVFSLLKRFLSRQYGVTFVANITDVNDKIYAAAGDGSSAELAREMTARYVADTDRLGLGRPDLEPKATETIGPIVALIQDLVDSGHAYASDGDVYFRVRSFPEYGKLSNRPVEQMDQGEDDEGPKEDQLDFALWKAQKPGEDTAWDAPWGRGRPGWHIECSAMAEDAFGGVDFEIHGGGSDLIFPHHENEIAQTEAARGEPLAKIWMHNGMLQFDREKMSKSVGNISLLSVALDEYGRDALVMFFVRSHYRKPVEYSAAALEDAGRAVERIRELARRLDPGGPALPGYEERFHAALDDDFDTPAAVAVVFELVADANRRIARGERVGEGSLRGMLWTLGLDNLLDAGDDTPDADALRL